jgi:hypothetical protein
MSAAMLPTLGEEKPEEELMGKVCYVNIIYENKDIIQLNPKK